MGAGFANPATLISARLLLGSREPKCTPDDVAALVCRRLDTAFALRNELYTQPYYRLIHAEGDFLPGLVVDRYDDVLIVQIATAGMESLRDVICDHLATISGCSTIHLANSLSARDLEQLDRTERTALGTLPETLTVKENDCTFKVDARQGQKTGWFYDHRDNRQLAASMANGKRVLDVFCYTGGWSIAAAVAGAESVTCVDSSEAAMGWLQTNAGDNGVSDKITPITSDAIEALKALHASESQFDLVILDPPAFIKRKKDYAKGVQHYELLNRLACRVLKEGGTLVSASCSQAMSAEELLQITRRSGARRGLETQVLHALSQGPDHPVLAGVPETQYLKGWMARMH